MADDLKTGEFAISFADYTDQIVGAKGDTTTSTIYTLSLKFAQTETATSFYPVISML